MDLLGIGSLLKTIWCAILSVPYYIADFLVMILNALVVALGALGQGLLALCPPFPDPPTQPAGGWVGYLNWFLPVGGLLAGLMVFVTLWLTFLVLRTALKWVKAL